MITYVYVVKCPNCEDEFFDFFDDAKDFAMGCLSNKPIITQTEVHRNDFGECTDHCDLGTQWSWEDECQTETEPAEAVFTKDDLKNPPVESDPEFDYDDSDFRFINEELLESRRISFNNKADQQEFFKLCKETGMITAADLDRFMKDHDADDGNLLDTLRAYRDELDNPIDECAERKPIPEGMTIEELVETMEENEDTVECSKCGNLVEKAECHHNKEGFGWCCAECEPADTLVEEAVEYDLATLVKDSINHLVNDLGKDSSADDFADDIIADIENNYTVEVPEDMDKYSDWCSAVACEVSRQLNRSEPIAEDMSKGTYDPDEELEFEYSNLSTTVAGNQRDVDDWDEATYTSDYTYKTTAADVADTIWTWFITDEDVKDVPGGLDYLYENNDAWIEFLNEHFWDLHDKYYDELCKHYRSNAQSDFEDNASWDDYKDSQSWW